MFAPPLYHPKSEKHGRQAVMDQSVTEFDLPCFRFTPFFFTFWRMKQVAVGILIKNGRVLACQRKRTVRYPLKWEFPGGKLEHDESPEHALVRELREELCIEAVVGSLLHKQEWVYEESITETHKDGAFKVYYFLVPSFSGRPTNRTFEQIRWVTPVELQSMDILEGNRSAVDQLVKHAERQEEPRA